MVPLILRDFMERLNFGKMLKGGMVVFTILRLCCIGIFAQSLLFQTLIKILIEDLHLLCVPVCYAHKCSRDSGRGNTTYFYC